MRKSLSNVGGPIASGGDPVRAAELEQAVRAAEGDAAGRLTHGFHAYPARMHASLARVALERFAGKGARVLDPFCGSGTVLVEAMVAGLRGRGVDLNPIAVRLAGVKCTRRDADARAQLVENAKATAERSHARVKARTPVSAPLSAEQVRAYAPHVLKELAGLREEIGDDRVLQVVFSSLVIKFSNKMAETSGASASKSIGKGVPTSFFVRKTEELAARWAELDRACAAVEGDVHRPRIVEGDATRLDEALPPDWRADLVLTSPPYGGTYDYVDHHALRCAWLGLPARRFEQREIGARRNVTAALWDRQVTAMLRSVGGVLAPEGSALLYVGDAEADGQRIDARAQLNRLAPTAGLRVVAWAGQERRDWQGGPRRAESLVMLAPA